MKIAEISVGTWRHFRNIKFTISPDAPLVCLVGANGSGKSQLLELIAACAFRVGLSPGTSAPRGDPFSESSEFYVTFQIPEGTFPGLDEALNSNPQVIEQLSGWNRKVTVGKISGQEIRRAGDDDTRTQLASSIQLFLSISQEIHYLALDADRSYPRMQVQSHELGSIFDRDWKTTGKQSSFQVTRTLYEEWFKYLIARESAENNNFVSNTRLARERNEPDPVFKDHFLGYKNSLQKVLPHLIFKGVNSQTREIKFDSTGMDPAFTS